MKLFKNRKDIEKIEEGHTKNYNIVKAIMNNWDPAYLLEMDAPDCEYDLEIKKILSKINDLNSVEELGQYIYDLFIWAFDNTIKTKALDIKECQKVAKEILDKLGQ